MNDEGVGRQSGRSRQVGSRQRRPLACHLVGNCTQLTTKSQPTNLRHPGILVPSSSTRVEPDDFSAQTNQFHGISLAGSEWVCRRRAELRQTFLCQRSRQGCSVSSGTCQPSYIRGILVRLVMCVMVGHRKLKIEIIKLLTILC